MKDETEPVRKVMVTLINSSVESDDIKKERARLESNYGPVWNTQELSQQFEVIRFLAPFVTVKNRVTGEKGSLTFQHSPRFYFNFCAD